MTEFNKKLIAIIAAIVFASVAIGLGISAINKINQLNNKVDNLNSKVAQLNNNDYYLESQISNLKNEIKNQLEEQSKNYFDAGYKIAGLNSQSKIATVEVYFSLKESSVFGDVQISFGKDNQFSQINATKLADGKYMAEIEFQIDKDYEISYSVVLSNIKTEKILDINILKQLKNRFDFRLSYDYPQDSRGTWLMAFYLSNNYSKDNNLKISTAVLEIYKNGVLVKTLDLKSYSVYTETGYEQFSSKDVQISELTHEDFASGNFQTKIAVTDNYGLEYIFRE